MMVILPYLLLVILSHETLYLHRAKISVKLTISRSKSYGENRQNIYKYLGGTIVETRVP